MQCPLRSLALLALCFPAISNATSVQRCVDAEGKTLFTTLGCPDGNDTYQQEAFNASPGSVVPLLPYREPTTGTTRSELVVIGQQDDGCGNRLTGDRLRKAKLEGATPSGMTRKDVESVLGKPDRVVRRNGETRYTYRERNGRSSIVTFDEHGCVKGKR